MHMSPLFKFVEMDYTFFIYIKSSSVACTNMVTLYNKVSFVNIS